MRSGGQECESDVAIATHNSQLQASHGMTNVILLMY